MAEPLTAHDLLPLVEKLSHDEQVRLAKLALRAAAITAEGYEQATTTVVIGTDHCGLSETRNVRVELRATGAATSG